MNGKREQILRSVLEKTAADLKALSLTADTMCMGLEREKMEPQATANLKAIVMGLSYIQRNISNALKIKTRNRIRHE